MKMTLSSAQVLFISLVEAKKFSGLKQNTCGRKCDFTVLIGISRQDGPSRKMESEMKPSHFTVEATTSRRRLLRGIPLEGEAVGTDNSASLFESYLPTRTSR